MEGSVSLACLEAGCKACVKEIRGGRTAVRRLWEMGVCPGRELCLLRNDFHGPVIVLIGSSRIAIGRGMAQKVLVGSPAEER